VSIVNDNFVTAESLLDHYKRVLSRTRDKPKPPIVMISRPPAIPKKVVALPPIPPMKNITPDDIANTGTPNVRGARKVVAPILLRRNLVWADIIRDNRHKEFVLARREIYYALRELGWSYPAIGDFCQRDHTSVLYAVQKWAEHLSKTKGENHADD
jgi:hypothetical protein